jgi:hypothetical protein
MNDERNDKAELYFCYGADMLQSQIERACGNPVFVSLACLRDFRVVFVGHSKKWDGAEEALVKSPGSEVWGVVYRLGYTDGDSLDAWKDIRLNGTGSRFHYPVTVTAPDGTEIPALIYQKSELGEARNPATEYLALVVSGAKERRLPKRYIDALMNVATTPARYPVPRQSAVGQELVAGLSCDCGR